MLPQVNAYRVNRTTAAAAVAVSAALSFCALSPRATHAQPMQRPITIVGYFERTQAADPRITREIALTTDGRERRPFGIIDALSNVDTTATDVFRASLRPVIRVRGRAEMISQLGAATPEQRVTINGMFDVRGNAITLNRVEVEDAKPATD